MSSFSLFPLGVNTGLVRRMPSFAFFCPWESIRERPGYMDDSDQDPHHMSRSLPMFTIHTIITNLRNFGVRITVVIRRYESNPSRHHLNHSLKVSFQIDFIIFHHWSVSKLLNSWKLILTHLLGCWYRVVHLFCFQSGCQPFRTFLSLAFGGDPSNPVKKPSEWREPMRWTPCIKIYVSFKTDGGCMVASQCALKCAIYTSISRSDLWWFHVWFHMDSDEDQVGKSESSEA